jgi:hypothetical protein
MICDFCSAPSPTREYPAWDFCVRNVPLVSVREWWACATCARIIDMGDVEQLATRAVNCQAARLDAVRRELLRDELRAFYGLFMRARI